MDVAKGGLSSSRSFAVGNPCCVFCWVSLWYTTQYALHTTGRTLLVLLLFRYHPPHLGLLISKTFHSKNALSFGAPKRMKEYKISMEILFKENFDLRCCFYLLMYTSLLKTSQYEKVYYANIMCGIRTHIHTSLNSVRLRVNRHLKCHIVSAFMYTIV